jgi:hypothetical protein
VVTPIYPWQGAGEDNDRVFGYRYENRYFQADEIFRAQEEKSRERYRCHIASVLLKELPNFLQSDPL